MHRHRSIIPWFRLVLAAALGLASTAGWAASPAATAAPVAPSEVDPADLAAFRAQQWARLAASTHRDDLVAAVLLGMADESGAGRLPGAAALEQRLLDAHPDDARLLFALASACQRQREPCAQPLAVDALVRVAPDNAVHWLLRPNDATPTDAQLHSAARASYADSHPRDIVAVLRAALPPGALRRAAIARVPLPKLGISAPCTAPPATRRDDCLALARRLVDDAGGAIITRMVGSAIVRRLASDTREAAAAFELRRQFVWMDERLAAMTPDQREALQADVPASGEWNAWLHALARSGAAARPPADWVPRHPDMLLLPEQRRPAQ